MYKNYMVPTITHIQEEAKILQAILGTLITS